MPPLRSIPTRSRATAPAAAFALLAGLLLCLALSAGAIATSREPARGGEAGDPQTEVAGGPEGESDARGGIQPGWIAFGTAIVYVLVLGRRSVTQLPPPESDTESAGTSPPRAGEPPSSETRGSLHQDEAQVS